MFVRTRGSDGQSTSYAKAHSNRIRCKFPVFPCSAICANRLRGPFPGEMGRPGDDVPSEVAEFPENFPVCGKYNQRGVRCRLRPPPFSLLWGGTFWLAIYSGDIGGEMAGPGRKRERQRIEAGLELPTWRHGSPGSRRCSNRLLRPSS